MKLGERRLGVGCQSIALTEASDREEGEHRSGDDHDGPNPSEPRVPAVGDI